MIKLERICYRTEQAIEVTGLSRTALYRLRKLGYIKTINVGKVVLYPRDELENFVEVYKDQTIKI